MKEIELTNGMRTQVDDCDFEALSHYFWQFHKSENGLGGYAARRVGSARKRTTKWIMMARVIMNAADGVLVDHCDRNKLNNQRYNLRLCTDTQNVWNRAKHKAANKFLGVQQTGASRFSAIICHQRKPIYLGTFDSAEAAARAYDAKAQELRGNFAVPNFPVEK